MTVETGAESPDDNPEVLTDDNADIVTAKLIADSTGQSVEDVLAIRSIKDQLSPIITEILNASPGTFIGTKMPLRPQDPIELHLKGKVSPKVGEIVELSGLNVIIRDGQPYSMDELTELQASMLDVLRELGINETSSSIGLPPSGAQLDLTYARQQAGLNKDEVRKIISAKLPEPFMALVSMSDDGPIPAFIPQIDARGGMTMTGWKPTGENGLCTSGFSVIHETGATGVTSAGHCNYMDTIHVAYGSGSDPVIPGGSHQGFWGDASWFKTPYSDATFYAGSGGPLTVTDVRIVQEIAVGDTVCVFGRGSLATRARPTPSCDTVDRLAGTCGNTGLNNLYLTSRGDNAIGGDSGGPWYAFGTAIGLHGGICAAAGYRNGFTAADRTDEALAVKVRARDWIVRGETLNSGQEKISKSGNVKFAMQGDGNLVKYTRISGAWVAGWNSGTFTPGSRAVMQGDGNFVVYRPNNTAAWQSATNQPNSYVKVQGDNVVIYSNARSALWATG